MVALDPRHGDKAVALQGWFEFELDLPESRSRTLGERVYVRFDHGWEPLAWRWLRAGRQLFMRRFTV
jgi:putative peptide zinc metalloprotease protein